MNNPAIANSRAFSSETDNSENNEYMSCELIFFFDILYTILFIFHLYTCLVSMICVARYDTIRTFIFLIRKSPSIQIKVNDDEITMTIMKPIDI